MREKFFSKAVDENRDGVLLLYAYRHRKLLNCTSLKCRELQIKLLILNSITALRNKQWLEPYIDVHGSKFVARRK
jgi:hypothetical protein